MKFTQDRDQPTPTWEANSQTSIPAYFKHRTPLLRNPWVTQTSWSIAFLLTLLGCSASQPQPKPGDHPFSLQPTEVTQLSLAKNDPTQNLSWMVHLKKNQKTWSLDGISTGDSLSDRKANTTWIEHLLDTISSLQLNAQAPQGALSDFGLEPPRLALKISTAQKDLSFHFGIPSPQGSYYFQAPSLSQPWLISGVTLKLLESIQHWSELRMRTLSDSTPDDVDEIEIRRDHQVLLYSQRDGDTWTDARHRPTKKPIQDFLNNFLTLPIERFQDQMIFSQLSDFKKFSPKMIHLQLRGRTLPSLDLWIAKKNSHFQIYYPERGRSPFQMSQKSIGFLTEYFK